jgi:Orotidine-5''-phosphate decarboxylase
LKLGISLFLIPGIGAQGGDLEASVSSGNTNGIALINVSRGILYSKDPALAAIDYKSKINLVLKNLVGT